jgi:hypothetical protein
MKLKLLLILLLGCAGFFVAWRHHQKAQLIKIRDGAIRSMDPHVAEKLQHYVDR